MGNIKYSGSFGLGLPGVGRVGLSNKPPVQGAAADPDFASVVLLLDFAGADAATDITDLSNTPHTDTFTGAAAVDTAVQLLGENTLLTNASGDSVRFPAHADWYFGTGDFTVEFSARFITLDGNPCFIGGMWNNDTDGWYINFFTSGDTIRLIHGGSIVVSESWTPSINTNYHIAVCRSGTDLRVFIDGVQLGTTTTDSTDLTTKAGELLHLGEIFNNTNPFKGNLGAVRITKGIGRYTANFTPPSEFYPTS